MSDDLLSALPRQDRRLIDAMAAEAGVAAPALVLALAREYLNLARSAPAALPTNSMRRLSADLIRGRS